ncbi:MAG: DUF86 domain-containing protein [Actinomycetota bacterium]|nr:MAG: hypothetical protein FD171_136 [Actinomycetota bacterium]MDP3629531.1 DUF86 domain-containing protein [Actinomycetota bacterium]
MSGQRDESLVLDDIIDAARRLIDLGSDVPTATIGLDRDHNEMILWNLVVLGEATKRLDASTRARFTQVPWSSVARTRDRVTHHYEGIDWETVGQIIDIDLPVVLKQLVAIRDTLRAEFDAT